MKANQTSEWLLDCLRADAGGGTAAGLDGLPQSDWDLVIALASKHGIAPLAYERLRGRPLSGKIPQAVSGKLRESYLGNAVRNVKLYHELGQVLCGLRQAGIPVIVLKGAYLAEAVYRNIALRTIITDVDLLVPILDFPKAHKSLLIHGYSEDAPLDFEELRKIEFMRSVNVLEL